jgi:hypothetical protein
MNERSYMRPRRNYPYRLLVMAAVQILSACPLTPKTCQPWRSLPFSDGPQLLERGDMNMAFTFLNSSCS